MAIQSGYFKKHLRVDLTEGRCERLSLDDAFIEQYIGGRGFGAKLVWDNLVAHDFQVDPLGPENLVVIAPGPLTGTYLPSSGKNSFVSLSPATGVYGDSSIGGSFGIDIPPWIQAPINAARCGASRSTPPTITIGRFTPYSFQTSHLMTRPLPP